MNKLFLAVLISLISTATSVSVFAEKIPLPLKVGALVSLSGDTAGWGKAFKNGAELALSKLPEEERKNLDVIFEDDGLNVSRTLSAYNKLSSSQDVKVFISLSSGTSKALAPILDSKGNILIAVASDAEISAGKKSIFNFWVTPEAEAEVFVKHVLKNNLKKLAFFSTSHTGTLSIRNSALEQLGSKVEVTLNEEIPYETRSFREVILKLKRNAPDIIVPILLPGQVGVFCRQVREMGITAPFVGFETFEDITEVKSANGALLNAIYVSSGEEDQKFMTEYKQKYPKDSSLSSSNAYDAIMMLAQAIKEHAKDGAIEFDTLNKFLHKVKNFKGASGTFSSSGDNRFTLPAEFKKVGKDGFEFIK